MSAVLESPQRSRIDQAKADLQAAGLALESIDLRIANCKTEQDIRERQQIKHRTEVMRAVSDNKPVPAAPKPIATDADLLLPILHGERSKLTERISECEGALRRELVNEVERRYSQAQARFAQASEHLVSAWSEVVGLRSVLDQAGLTADPLPHSMTSSFAIVAIGRMSTISPNHWAHFLASHAMAQGEGKRAMWRERERIEAEVGRLPW
jgi:hypothetical protein